tara:strand:- start:271 stop:444 length:174 start_codon:yes stop_codon:yes gene_type:complete
MKGDMNSNNLAESRFPHMMWNLDWNWLKAFMEIVERGIKKYHAREPHLLNEIELELL